MIKSNNINNLKIIDFQSKPIISDHKDLSRNFYQNTHNLNIKTDQNDLKTFENFLLSQAPVTTENIQKLSEN